MIDGRLLAVCDGLDHRVGTADHVPRGENTGAAGLHGRGVHLHRVPGRDLEPARPCRSDRVDPRILADGHDQRVEIDDVLGTLDRHRPASAALVGIAELVPDALQTRQRAVLADDPDGRHEGLDADALLIRGLDLLREGGHLVPGPPVEDGDAFHLLEAQCHAGRIDGGVAASDDPDLAFRELLLFAG